jgi:ribokinase
VTAVCVCGSANLDLFAYAERLPLPGETLHGERLARTPGGKGANQAVAAARLGATVRFHGARGDDAEGARVAAEMAAAGVDIAGLRAVDAPTGIALIVVDAAGRNQIVTVAGANDLVGAPPADADAAVWLTDADVPVAAVAGTLAAARATGAVAILTPAPAGRVPGELARGFDIVVANETEVAALGDTAPAAVVLTLGERGVRLLPSGEELPAPPADVLDTTGAGDALVGGLAAGLAEGMRLGDAVRLGMAAAAVCVGRPGCQPAMPTRAEAEAVTR